MKLTISGMGVGATPQVPGQVVGLLASLLLTCACLVADPPQYEEPGRTPPILDLAAAKPFPGEIIVLDTRDNFSATDQVVISIPIRSEDRGEDLVAALYIDYTFPSSRFVNLYSIPASTLEDTTRRISFSWNASGFKAGCHQLTVLVSHETTFSLDELKPKDRYDTAIATWWMNVDPPIDDPYTLSRCPNGGEVQQ